MSQCDCLSLVLRDVTLQEWMDVNLAWNASEYGNVQDVRIPPSSLWKPDILMYNRLVSSHSSHLTPISHKYSPTD